MSSRRGVRVLRDDGNAVPFTLRGQSLEFFSGTPGTVRVLAGDREICLLADSAAALGIQMGCPAGNAARHSRSSRRWPVKPPTCGHGWR